MVLESLWGSMHYRFVRDAEARFLIFHLRHFMVLQSIVEKLVRLKILNSVKQSSNYVKLPDLGEKK